MEDGYLKAKAAGSARAIAGGLKIDYGTALLITQSVWEEARSCILRAAGTDEWQRLSFSEKAYICREVVRGLFDRKRLTGFLSGERKSIV